MTPAEARGILGLSQDAGMNELKDAYKRRSKFMHPDRFAGRPEGEIKFATAEFQRLTKARDVLYKVLSDAWDIPSGNDADGSSQEKPTDVTSATRITVTIPREQAVEGGVILVHTLAGDRLRIRLPRSFKLNNTIRVKRRGDVMLPSGVQNDLIVDLQVDYGQKHFRDEEQRSDTSDLQSGNKDRVGQPSAKDERKDKIFFRVASTIVSCVILSGILVTVYDDKEPGPTTAARDSNTIDYVAEFDEKTPCPVGSGGCWAWTVTPEEGCREATAHIELARSETAGWSQRMPVAVRNLVAGNMTTVVATSDNTELDFAGISSITCTTR